MRIYTSQELGLGTLVLPPEQSHHLGRVLRAKIGDILYVFNGQGQEHPAKIIEISKKAVTLEVGKGIEKDRESPLSLNLAQGICRTDKMDFIVQKAVELGVSSLTPVITQFSQRLDSERLESKMHHWQQIIISASEQCERNRLMVLQVPQTLDNYLKAPQDGDKLILHPRQTGTSFHDTPNSKIHILIGPEGGFQELEVDRALQNGYQALSLGPRILRTETAALATICYLQTRFGDF